MFQYNILLCMNIDHTVYIVHCVDTLYSMSHYEILPGSVFYIHCVTVLKPKMDFMSIGIFTTCLLFLCTPVGEFGLYLSN